MCGKEAVVGSTVAVYDMHRIAKHRVVARTPASEKRLRNKISHSVSQQHTQKGASGNKQNLRHRLVVLHYKQKQGEVYWYPCEAGCENCHPMVGKQIVAVVKKQQQSSVIFQ